MTSPSRHDSQLLDIAASDDGHASDRMIVPIFSDTPSVRLGAMRRAGHPRRLAAALRTIAGRSECSASGDHTVANRDTFADRDSFVSPDSPAMIAVRRPSGHSDIPQAVQMDRRSSLRRRSTHIVRVLPQNDVAISEPVLARALHDSPYRGRMIDISTSGVTFLLDARLPEAQRVWLRLENRTRDYAVTRSAQVIRLSQHADARWSTTCRFDSCLPYHEVLQFGQQPAGCF